MPIVIDSRRGKLLKYLKNQIKTMEKSGSQGNAQITLLRRAVEGLEALEYGESQSMFAPGPRKGSHDGTKPYTIRKLKMQALGYGDLLIANNYKGKGTAIVTVANAYGQAADAYRGWRKSRRLAKTTDARMQAFRAQIAKLPWDEAQVLKSLEKSGADFLVEKRLAHKSKKTKE